MVLKNSVDMRILVVSGAFFIGIANANEAECANNASVASDPTVFEFRDGFEKGNVKKPNFCPNRKAGHCRPYDKTSPWNTKIDPSVGIHPRSVALIRAISDNNKPLTSDPDQYDTRLFV